MTEPNEQPEEQEPETGEELPQEPQEPTEGEGETEEQGEQPEPSEEQQEPVSNVQPGAKSEKDIEAAMGKLATEAKRHAKRISEIMDEDALALIPCELCWPPTPGFRYEQVPDGQRAAVMLAIGFDPEPDLEADTHASACPACKGFGNVATGSKVQGQSALPCLNCGGSGWMGDRRTQPIALAPAPPPIEQGNGPQPPIVESPDLARLKAEAARLGVAVIGSPVAPVGG